MNNSLRKNIRLIIENIDKNFVVCQNCFHSWDIKEFDPRPYFCHSCGFDNKKKEFDIDGLKDWVKKYNKLNESLDSGGEREVTDFTIKNNIYYHGTSSNIDSNFIFNDIVKDFSAYSSNWSRNIQGLGKFYTQSILNAYSFVDFRSTDEGNIVEIYFNPQNKYNAVSITKLIKILEKYGEKNNITDIVDRNKMFVEFLIKKGYDSIVLKEGPQYNPLSRKYSAEVIIPLIKDNIKILNVYKAKTRNGGIYSESKIYIKRLIRESFSAIFEADYVDDKRKLIVLVGPPSVGKSTWIKSNFPNAYIINRDDIVESVASSYGWTYDDMYAMPSKDAKVGDVDEKYGTVIKAPESISWVQTVFDKVLEANERVSELLYLRGVDAHPSSQDIVIDMTNMNVAQRKYALKTIEGYEGEYHKVAVDFKFKGAEELIKKIARKRAEEMKKVGKYKTIPNASFDRMFSAYEEPTTAEGFDEIISVDNIDNLKKAL